MTDAEIIVLLAIFSIAPVAIAFAWWRVSRHQLRRKLSPPQRLVVASHVSYIQVGAQIDDMVNQIGFSAFVDSLLADETRSSFGPLLQALDLDGPTRDSAVAALTRLLPLVTQINFFTLRPPERSAFYNILARQHSGNRHDSNLIIEAVSVIVRLRDFQAIPYLEQVVDSHIERVRTAAKEAATQLLAIKHAEVASATLLRSTSPQMNPLLRSVGASNNAEQDLLLRALAKANNDPEYMN